MFLECNRSDSERNVFIFKPPTPLLVHECTSESERNLNDGNDFRRQFKSIDRRANNKLFENTLTECINTSVPGSRRRLYYYDGVQIHRQNSPFSRSTAVSTITTDAPTGHPIHWKSILFFPGLFPTDVRERDISPNTFFHCPRTILPNDQRQARFRVRRSVAFIVVRQKYYYRTHYITVGRIRGKFYRTRSSSFFFFMLKITFFFSFACCGPRNSLSVGTLKHVSRWRRGGSKWKKIVTRALLVTSINSAGHVTIF